MPQRCSGCEQPMELREMVWWRPFGVLLPYLYIRTEQIMYRLLRWSHRRSSFTVRWQFYVCDDCRRAETISACRADQIKQRKR